MFTKENADLESLETLEQCLELENCWKVHTLANLSLLTGLLDKKREGGSNDPLPYIVRSINPISTGGHILLPPPGFSGLPTALSDDSTSIKLVTQHFFFSKINYRVEDCAAIFVLYSTLKSISKNIKSF